MSSKIWKSIGIGLGAFLLFIILYITIFALGMKNFFSNLDSTNQINTISQPTSSGKITTTSGDTVMSGGVETGMQDTLSTEKEKKIIQESSSIIQNTLSKDAINAIAKVYGPAYTKLENSYQLGDYFITWADDNSNQPGSSIEIVMGKFNNTWLPLYEGNSGEITCKIVSEFGFPQELLDAYGTKCYETQDYHTIPKKTLQYLSKN